jgi:hypothetical protein
MEGDGREEDQGRPDAGPTHEAEARRRRPTPIADADRRRRSPTPKTTKADGPVSVDVNARRARSVVGLHENVHVERGRISSQVASDAPQARQS